MVSSRGSGESAKLPFFPLNFCNQQLPNQTYWLRMTAKFCIIPLKFNPHANLCLNPILTLMLNAKFSCSSNMCELEKMIKTSRMSATTTTTTTTDRKRRCTESSLICYTQIGKDESFQITLDWCSYIPIRLMFRLVSLKTLLRLTE